MIDDTELAHRVRAVLANRPSVREVKMFGGLAFMVDDTMVVSVGGDGVSLLVRVDPDHDAELLTHDGAERAHMGSGRPMGQGWISITTDAIDSDELLDFWMDTALDHHATQAADGQRRPTP